MKKSLVARHAADSERTTMKATRPKNAAPFRATDPFVTDLLGNINLGKTVVQLRKDSNGEIVRSELLTDVVLHD